MVVQTTDAQAGTAGQTTAGQTIDAGLGNTGLPTASDLLNPPVDSVSIDGQPHFWNVPKLFSPPGASKKLKGFIINVDKAIQVAVDLLGEGTCEAPPTPAELAAPPPTLDQPGTSAINAGYVAVSARSQATADSLAAAHTQVVQVTGAAADGKGATLIRIQDVVSVLQSLLHSVSGIPKLTAPDETQLMKILGEAVTAIYDKIQQVAAANQTMAGNGTSDGTTTGTGTTGTGTTLTGTGPIDTGSGATDITGASSTGTSAAGGSSALSGMLPLLSMLAMPIEQVIQSVTGALQGKDAKQQGRNLGDPRLTDLQQQHDTVAQTVTTQADAPQIVDGSQVTAPTVATAAPVSATAAPVAVTADPAAATADPAVATADPAVATATANAAPVVGRSDTSPSPDTAAPGETLLL